MKIGIVTTWFERGAAYVSKQYLEALKTDNEIFIYARGGEHFAEKDSAWSKYNVTWGSQGWGKDFKEESRRKNIEHFKKWLDEICPDVVFFNEEHWWEPVILCNDLGIKTGAYIDYYTKETNPFFILYDFLICNTKRHLSAFKWHPQAFYIPWGTEIEIFKPKQFKLVEKDKITFFHSAGMNPFRKGTDTLLKSFYSLNFENSKLVIHSQKKLKVIFPNLKNIIEELEKKNKLVLYERTVSAPGLYYMGDVYVYPTVLEGIGLTIAEALSSGLSVIVSDNAPMNEFVNNEVGRLVKIKRLQKRDDDYFWPMCEPDENSLIEAMHYYCDNIAELPLLKKKAREYAELNLDWYKNSKNLSDIFLKAVIVPKNKKTDIEKAVLDYEKIKQSKVRRFIHKIKILKLAFIPFLIKYIKNKIFKTVWMKEK